MWKPAILGIQTQKTTARTRRKVTTCLYPKPKIRAKSLSTLIAVSVSSDTVVRTAKLTALTSADYTQRSIHRSDSTRPFHIIMYQSNRSFNNPPPRATPRAFEFLENFCSNSPLTGPKSCSNAPTLGKITRLLFELFSSFYYASEAVHVNMVY